MQRLIPINVGQQANDRSGDPLRDGMAKVNENFAKVTTAMDAVETAVAQTSALAGSARDIAAAALPAAQKNRPGGVAPLDADGKVPAGNLPDSVPMSQRARPVAWRRWTRRARCRPVICRFHTPVAEGRGGRCDAVGRQRQGAGRPSAEAGHLPVIQRGAPDGVAPLDAQGKVPAANLPAVEDAIPLAQKGQPNGVAALAADGKVPAAQLPLIESIPMGFVAWAPKRARSGRAGFPAMDSSCRGRRFRIWRRRRRRRCSGRVRGRVAGGSAQAGLTRWRWDHQYSRAGLQRQVRRRDWRGLSPGMARCPWRMARSRLARTRLMVTRFNLPSICMWKRMAPVPSWGSLDEYACVSPIYVRRRGPEAHPSFISGCFVIKAFGAVSRPGSVDARNWPAGSPFLRRRSRPISTSSCSIPAVRRRLPGSSIRTPHRR